MDHYLLCEGLPTSSPLQEGREPLFRAMPPASAEVVRLGAPPPPPPPMMSSVMTSGEGGSSVSSLRSSTQSEDGELQVAPSSPCMPLSSLQEEALEDWEALQEEKQLMREEAVRMPTIVESNSELFGSRPPSRAASHGSRPPSRTASLLTSPAGLEDAASEAATRAAADAASKAAVETVIQLLADENSAAKEGAAASLPPSLEASAPATLGLPTSGTSNGDDAGAGDLVEATRRSQSFSLLRKLPRSTSLPRRALSLHGRARAPTPTHRAEPAQPRRWMSASLRLWRRWLVGRGQSKRPPKAQQWL